MHNNIVKDANHWHALLKQAITSLKRLLDLLMNFVHFKLKINIVEHRQASFLQR